MQRFRSLEAVKGNETSRIRHFSGHQLARVSLAAVNPTGSAGSLGEEQTQHMAVGGWQHAGQLSPDASPKAQLRRDPAAAALPSSRTPGLTTSEPPRRPRSALRCRCAPTASASLLLVSPASRAHLCISTSAGRLRVFPIIHLAKKRAEFSFGI